MARGTAKVISLPVRGKPPVQVQQAVEAPVQQMAQTPNLHLNLPPYGYLYWDTPVNQNFVILDGLVSGTPSGGYAGTWSASQTYTQNQIVTSGNFTYISLIASNLNQPPSSSPSAWTPLGMLTAPPAPPAPLVLGYIIDNGATGTNVGPVLIAARAGSLTKCKIAVKTSDVATGLTTKVNKNGVDIFATDPSLVPGASGLSTFTAFTNNPLSVAADDMFTIDISSGSANWAFTVQLE